MRMEAKRNGWIRIESELVLLLVREDDTREQITDSIA
jgi:hypothetical protein